MFLLLITNSFLIASPPIPWPNTFSPAIGFNKKGLTLGNKKDGFTEMTPVFYTPKQPGVHVNNADSLHLTQSKFLIKTALPAPDSVLFSDHNLKHISDSVVQEGLNLYKLGKLARISRNMMSEAKTDIIFPDYIPFLDKDTVKVSYYTSGSTGIKINYTAILHEKDSIIPANIQLKKEDRLPTQKEQRLIGIKNEINTFVQESPSLNENKNVMNFDMYALEKNNLFYFYLLPVSIESGQFYMGGDYIFKFTKDDKLLSIEPQHKGLIRVHKLPDTTIYFCAHSHLDEYSHFITATDICQAKLYAKQTVRFSDFKVIATQFESSFNTETNVIKITKSKR